MVWMNLLGNGLDGPGWARWGLDRHGMDYFLTERSGTAGIGEHRHGEEWKGMDKFLGVRTALEWTGMVRKRKARLA